MSTSQTEGPAAGSGDNEGAKKSAGVIAAAGGVGLLLLFMLQNSDDVRVSFLVWDFTWPVWMLVLVSALLGAVIWLGLGVLRRHRRRKDRREDRRN